MVLSTATNTATTTASRLRGGCILFFFLFMTHGVVGPFLPLIWRGKGFTDLQVGVLGSIRPGISFFAAPAVSAVADLSGMHQRVLLAVLVLYGFSRPLMLAAGSMLAMAGLEVMAAFSESPANSLLDSGARHSFGASGYGKIRMWGGLGLGVASVLGGYVFDAGNGTYDGVMIVFAVMTIITIVVATEVPIFEDAISYQEFDETSDENHDSDHRGKDTASTAEELELSERNGSRLGFETSILTTTNTTTTTLNTTNTDGDIRNGDATRNQAERVPTTGDDIACTETTEKSTHRGGDEEPCLAESGEIGISLSTVSRALCTVDALSFLTVVVLSGMGGGFIDTFLFIRLHELGGSHTLLGTTRLIMCLAELPFFYLSGFMLRWMGPRGVAGLAQLGFIARFLYYSVLRDPVWVLPAEIMHGLTFACMWTSTIEFAHHISPAGSKTTMIGVFSGLHHGLGVGLGSLIGGYVYACLGAKSSFRVCAALPTISLLLLALPASLRFVHVGGGNGRNGEGREGQGLEGWDGAESVGVVLEEHPATDDERRDKDAGGSSRNNEHGDGRGEKEPRETTTEIAYVGVATA